MKVVSLKAKKVREVTFRLVKKKIEKDFLVITPNIIRFLALKLINEDQNLSVKILKSEILYSRQVIELD